MVKKTRQVLKNQRGVTLIELLAVVIILGIIAAIAAPAIIGSFDDAKANSDATTVAIIKDAGKRFLMDALEDVNWNNIDDATNITLNGTATTIDDQDTTTPDTLEITVNDLQTYGYLDEGDLRNQANGNYYTSVTITKSGNQYTYNVLDSVTP